MSASHPNHFRSRKGESGSHGEFGNSCSVIPINVHTGAGHTPHLAVNWEGFFELDLTPLALVNFIRAAEAALAKLPRRFQYVADNVGVGGDE